MSNLPRVGRGWETLRVSLTEVEYMSESTGTDFQSQEGDTGSSDVQIARLTERINHLTDHLSTHKKDFSSRRGLLRLVARRRKLLDYLKATEEDRYKKLLEALKLRR